MNVIKKINNMSLNMKIVLSLFILITGALSFMMIVAWNDSRNLEKDTIHVSNEEQAQIKADLQKSFESVTPTSELPSYGEMTEHEILNEVHGMTHQKVKADEKWGSSEITKEKVQMIYNVVENSDFKTRSMLIHIIEPWLKNDFSNAVEAHNAIWDYQDGNIGKATRLLTPAEEKAYIEEKFR